MIEPGWTVLTAWAEHCSGPGWSNEIVNVLLVSQWGTYRVQALQPNEQTERMKALFKLSALAAEEMRSAVESAIRTADKP